MSLGCIFNGSLCSQLPQQAGLKRLNERDLSLSMDVSSVFVPGIDLNTMIFDKMGYVANTTGAMLEALDVGLRRLYLDIYFDPVYLKWHLCPFRPPADVSVTTMNNVTETTFLTAHAATSVSVAPLTVKHEAVATETSINDQATHLKRDAANFADSNITDSRTNSNTTDSGGNNSTDGPCDYVLDLDLFVEKLKWYLDLSDTNIAADLVYLHLRPKFWSVPKNGTSPYSFGQDSLNSTFSSIANRVLSPIKLSDRSMSQNRHSKQAHKSVEPTVVNAYNDTHDDREYGHMKWPSLRTMLYSDTDRMVVSFNPGSLDGTPDVVNIDNLAFSADPSIENPGSYSLNELAERNFTDTFVSDSDKWRNVTLSGVSPVLNDTSLDFYSDDMEKFLESSSSWAWAPEQPILFSVESRIQDLSNFDDQELPACAVFTSNGLAVANCYAHFSALCKHNSNQLDWVLTGSENTYFAVDCPSDYTLGVPETPLEARVVREKYFGNSSNYTHDYAWVNFNSLFYPNCWVDGSATTVCPYNVVENDRNGVGFIIVAGTIAGVLGIVTSLFEWDRRRTPLLRNYRRRNNSRTVEYEGIPS